MLRSGVRHCRQLDAAEEAAIRAIDLLPEEGEQVRVCGSHRVLGEIYYFKGDTKKAIHHCELALGIASTFSWHDLLFWLHSDLAGLFRKEYRFDDAHAHIEHAKSHMADNAFYLGLVTERKAEVLYWQHRLEEARSEALRATDIYEKLGAAKNVGDCRYLLRGIEKELNIPVASGQSVFDCELLKISLSPACTYSSL